MERGEKLVKLIYSATILLFLFQNLAGQIDSSFPSIDKSNLPDARFKDPQVFTTETLTGYMNGGALLYREYGCLDAWINELSYQKGKYKIEIFRMYSPEEAFGIFSVLRNKCTYLDGLTDYSCISDHVLQVVAGRYFFRIINEKGSPADSLNSVKIAEAVICKIAEPSASLTDYLPGVSPSEIRSNAVLVKGKLGIQNGASEQEDYLANYAFQTAVIMPGAPKQLISVKFDTPEELVKFASGHNWKTESVSSTGNKMVSGENVKILSETHLLIEIPEIDKQD